MAGVSGGMLEVTATGFEKSAKRMNFSRSTVVQATAFAGRKPSVFK